MRLFTSRPSRLLAAFSLLLLAGCSSTPIAFEAPGNAVLFVNGQPHHLPASVELQRPAGAGQPNRYNVSLVFTSAQYGEIHANGTLDVFGYTESDVDKIVNNSCKLAPDQLDLLASGKTLVYKGQTASRQPLYEMTLKK